MSSGRWMTARRRLLLAGGTLPDSILSRRGLAAYLVCLPLTGGCQAALWGNLGVLAVSIGIFLGTLSLKRQALTTDSSHRSGSLPVDEMAEDDG